MNSHLETLCSLVDASLPFMLIGSAGLKLRHPMRMRDYVLPDVDMLVLPEDLDDIGHHLLGQGWDVRCWGEPWRPGDLVNGRWYLRAHHQMAQLDVTFECPFLDVRSTFHQIDWLDGLPVCPSAALWTIKIIKDPNKAVTFAQCYGLSIPKKAFEVAKEFIPPV